MHFVYIIYSLSHNKYYKGYSTDPRKRLVQHNNKESRYTTFTSDWGLVYVEAFADKKSALKRDAYFNFKGDVEKLINSF